MTTLDAPAHPAQPAASYTLEDATRALVDGTVLGPPAGARRPEDPEDRPTLPASVVRQVLVQPPSAGAAHPAGVRLRGLSITGQLDLGKATLLSPLTVEDCQFHEPIVLEDASGGSIGITDSKLQGLQGDGLHLRHSLALQRCTSEAEVRLAGAHIGAQLDLAGTRITTEVGQPALTAHLIKVDKGVLLVEGFHCEGQASFDLAQIGQFLALQHATFVNGVADALSLKDARIDGQLVASSTLSVEGTIDLARAHIADVELVDLSVTPADGAASVVAVGLQCSGDLVIGSANSVLRGRLELGQASAARVVLSGELGDGDGARAGHLALSAAGLTVRGSLLIAGSLRVKGWVDCRNSRIDGDLDLAGLDVEGLGVGYNAIVLAGASVGGALRTSAAFAVVGAVDAEGITVGRDLLVDGTWNAGTGVALSGPRAKVGGSVLLQPSLHLSGAVSLPNSQVGGDVVLAGRLGGVGLVALRLSGAQLQGSLIAAPATATESDAALVGQVDLEGLRCDGNVTLSALTCGQADAQEQTSAVLLNSARIGGGLYLREPFVAAPGGVVLDQARVQGTVNARGGKFGSTGGVSLSADGLVCGRLLLDGAEASGTINLVDARCDGLMMADTSVSGSFVGRRLKVAGPAHVCPRQLHGPVDLSYADVRVLRVNGTLLGSSPNVHEFAYAAIEGAAPDDFRRLLPRDGRFTGQPYEQLAQVLRRSGEPDVAVRVLVDMRSQQLRRTGASGPVRRRIGARGDRLVRAGLSFGYQPLKAVWWLLLLGAVGAVLCAVAWPEHFHAARADVPTFNPLVYSFDVLLPIIDFRQQDAWIPESYAQVWTWGVIAAGWVLSTALVVGLTRAMSRT